MIPLALMQELPALANRRPAKLRGRDNPAGPRRPAQGDLVRR